ncbi:L-histidine N(alpha)-methyltransferase [Larkinella soli]|uniref:L-histidine N(alpha)-methyltransferase n=1 Tax=Larkinella soli TaxID=1770527 RepID=UPI000FFB8BF7|nr:L-histidine N(alpha)-methyltransferase [Larkinella soli]
MAVHGNPFSEEINDRHTFNGNDPENPSLSALADEVRTGLARTPKRLSSRFFYDAEGSRIFQEIMHLPEYYLTRSEYEIISQQKEEMLRLFERPGEAFELIELGAGDGLKTKVLLEHFRQRQARFTYVPIDISADALDQLTRDLRGRWPDLAVEPLHDDYFRALETLSSRSEARKVVLFLGSNIGNFSEKEAIDFYRRLYAKLRPGDLVLTGIDLRKHPAVIQAAYNDRQGLTRAFNLNLLRRINRELEGEFDLSAFSHYEIYNPETGEARSYLVSEKKQDVRIGRLGLTVSFAYGEVIHTEISRKYNRTEIRRLAEATGFTPTAWFTDCREYFVDVVFERDAERRPGERRPGERRPGDDSEGPDR